LEPVEFKVIPSQKDVHVLTAERGVYFHILCSFCQVKELKHDYGGGMLCDMNILQLKKKLMIDTVKKFIFSVVRI
jgi:hypothetical protein